MNRNNAEGDPDRQLEIYQMTEQSLPIKVDDNETKKTGVFGESQNYSCF